MLFFKRKHIIRAMDEGTKDKTAWKNPDIDESESKSDSEELDSV